MVRESDVDAPRDRGRIHWFDQRRGGRLWTATAFRRSPSRQDSPRDPIRVLASWPFSHTARTPTQPWTVREIDRVPSAHRLRWYVDASGSALAHQLAARGRDGAAAELRWHTRRSTRIARRIGSAKPCRARSTASCTPSSRFAARFAAACLLSAGFAGVHRYEHVNGVWSHVAIAVGRSGAGSEGRIERCRRGPRPALRDWRLRSSSPRSSLGTAMRWSIYRRGASGAFERQVIDTRSSTVTRWSSPISTAMAWTRSSSDNAAGRGASGSTPQTPTDAVVEARRSTRAAWPPRAAPPSDLNGDGRDRHRLHRHGDGESQVVRESAVHRTQCRWRTPKKPAARTVRKEPAALRPLPASG